MALEHQSGRDRCALWRRRSHIKWLLIIFLFPALTAVSSPGGGGGRMDAAPPPDICPVTPSPLRLPLRLLSFSYFLLTYFFFCFFLRLLSCLIYLFHLFPLIPPISFSFLFSHTFFHFNLLYLFSRFDHQPSFFFLS